MLRNHLLTLTLVTALLAPAATAAWSVQGSFEPDTSYDATGGFMFADPDTDPDPGVKKVYFNAFVTNSWSGSNPNLATTEGRILTPGFQGPIAFLGVWKDCNADGYIGHFESAVMAYRSELLESDTICPYGSEHNRDSWVYEFRWIGDAENVPSYMAEEPEGSGNWVSKKRTDLLPARMIHDSAVRVWGDPGLPTSQAVIGCFINPQTGTFSSTGAILGWADCNGNRGVTDTYNQVLLGGTIEVAGESVDTPGADPSNSLGLAFDNREFPQCSSSKLNIELNLFDNDPRCPNGKTGLFQEQTDDRAFTVWDCSQPTGTADTYPAVSPSVDNPQGSYYESLNHTERGLYSDCNGSETTLGNWYDAINQEDPVPAATAQRDATFVFEFGSNIRSYNDNRKMNDTSTANYGRQVTNLYGDLLGDEAPEALSARGWPVLGIGAGYSSNVAQTNYPPTFRDDLSPEGGLYYTWYASVGPETAAAGAAVPSSSVGSYGAERCPAGSATPLSESGGFDCDPANWYPESENPEPRSYYSQRPIGARPGQAYNLRDIDCYDGTVTSALPGVGLGFTWLGQDGPCSVE